MNPRSKRLFSLGLLLKKIARKCAELLSLRIFIAKYPRSVPNGSIVLFPLQDGVLCCGLAGLIALKPREFPRLDLDPILKGFENIEQRSLSHSGRNGGKIPADYLGGDPFLSDLYRQVKDLSLSIPFSRIFLETEKQGVLARWVCRLSRVICTEGQRCSDLMGRLDTEDMEMMVRRVEWLRDISWCLEKELLRNVANVKYLLNTIENPSFQTIRFYKNLNTVLNSIDRLEVRGRDSAGISFMIYLQSHDLCELKRRIGEMNSSGEFEKRTSGDVLMNRDISIGSPSADLIGVAFTYKVAAEVGRLGDNVRSLRESIRNDRILQQIAPFEHWHCSISSHTRWASVGSITEPNCHPVDSRTTVPNSCQHGIIHACLNGDIDNYQELLKPYQDQIHPELTTDTKIIPLQVHQYIQAGHDVVEAFRRTVNDFEGSHAIAMHTDLAPGTLFLAQKGGGQSLFVGIGEECIMPASEVYGFVEETAQYYRMQGQKEGQICVIHQEVNKEWPSVVDFFHYEGTPVTVTESLLRTTQIRSRDIDRQHFPHYFLKEIFESPSSVERTLANRWRILEEPKELYGIEPVKEMIPLSLKEGFRQKQIRRIFFIGQGTAGVAAQACAEITEHYLLPLGLQVCSFKSSELSGFRMEETAGECGMSDTCVVAVTQSGTTTDTILAVDMARSRGACTLAIVNRRDSEICFKVDGVLYTSSGRDIEMSVASTKAFYSQIIAGALLGLALAEIGDCRDRTFISEEIKRLIEIPDHMQTILKMAPKIEASARRLAASRTYWAAVGSGPNKASADEIRIKLSELCYKTISSDYVEDKKHIDLSSEPLIFVCTAGTNGKVIGDIIKDTAIFKAHNALPIVIANEGEDRFDPYAEDIFHVPAIKQHLSPIVNTLVGHLWGYYAALTINDISNLLFDFRESLRNRIEAYSGKGMDVYEILLEDTFREEIMKFYHQFRALKAGKRIPTVIGLRSASDLILLLKYLAGRLPASDFELDFGVKGTATHILNKLFSCLDSCINGLARPVDAIKHQAKTVTVGTSRISEHDRAKGLFFDRLGAQGFDVTQLSNRNVILLRNLQSVISTIKGSILYRIDHLNLLGEPVDETTISVLSKDGALKDIPSRVEQDNRLVGTKKIVVQDGHVLVGKGRRDKRKFVVVPIMSHNRHVPRVIQYLFLMNVAFKKDVPLEKKISALGDKFHQIKNTVQESTVAWNDNMIDSIDVDKLFVESYEIIADLIIRKFNGTRNDKYIKIDANSINPHYYGNLEPSFV